ncbi:MAG: hypothetical protein OJI67_06630 [Prosthecobacter sp.]|nr:hypothetical protein [Prosthecobacter sp.]
MAANTEPPEVVTIEGPFELVGEGFNFAGTWISSGEYVRIGTTWASTLPYLREELAITLPISLVLALLFALTWIRKWT